MAYERAKLRKTANKKAASPKKSMRLRSATLFCSNQDTTVCFPTNNTHRAYSITQTLRKLKQFYAVLYYSATSLLIQIVG